MLVGPCAVALIMHATDDSMGSLSDWYAQGEPAVTVDYRVRDAVTPKPSLAPPQPPLLLPPTPLGWALGASQPQTSSASRGA